MAEPRTIVAFLTGQSDPARNALSPEQLAFLHRSPVPEEDILPENFPYRPTAPHREIPLWRAGIHNFLQYRRSRRPSFAADHRVEIFAKFAGSHQVVFLAGSCGLELLVNLHLPPEFLARVHVFAFGPVSRSLPDCARLVRVRGRGDLISKWHHPQVEYLVDCGGHMDYLRSGEIDGLFAEFYRSVAASTI
jgi:hypothetical protein